MAINAQTYTEILGELNIRAKLVAVSKTKSIGDIREMYDLGQREFAENYVQELLEKQAALPKDIRWHFIGHLQSNKVKFIAPFVALIQSVDSMKLLMELDKQGKKNERIVECLLQVHISREETKFGFDESELESLLSNIKKLEHLKNIKITGLMGMASFTDDQKKITGEFESLKLLYDKYVPLQFFNYEMSTLSMGMSADYKVAIERGSNMVRIGSLIFGERLSPSAESSK